MTIATSPDDGPDLLVDRDGPVLSLTLNRPERLNALTTSMLEQLAVELEHAAELAGGEQPVRVAVLRGAGRAFCAGALMRPGVVDEALMSAAARAIRAIVNAPFVVVAAVNGVSAGIGCSLATPADIAIAADNASFVQAFVNVALMPDGGATALLAASIGRARALQLALDGQRLDAERAQQMGLIAGCVPAESFDAEVAARVAHYAEGPTLAYVRLKQAVNAATLAGLEDALAREAAGQLELAATTDHAEGVAAFAEKRPPRFSGR